MNEIEMAVEKFYEGKAPTEIDSINFVRFISSADGIASTFLSKIQMLQFRIKVLKSATAYIDFESKTIVMPLWYITKESLEKIAPEMNPAYTSIALFNGSMAHESLHGKWTRIEGGFEGWGMKYFSSEIADYGKKYVMSIINICEDIFIESQNNPFEVFTRAKNQILFPSFKDDPNKVQVAVQYKNINLREEVEAALNEEQVKALQSFVNAPALDSANFRVDLFKKAIEAFSSSVEMVGSDGEGGESDGVEGSDESGEDGSESGSSSSSGGSDDGNYRNIDGDPSSSLETEGAEEVDNLEGYDQIEMMAKAEQIAQAVNTRMAKPKKAKFDGFSLPEIIECDVYEAPKKVYGAREFYMEIDTRFINLLRSIRNKNTTQGEPLKKGSRINVTNLHRIGTDGKVFSNPEVYNSKSDELEVGLLVDASGSMSRGNLFGKVLAATIQIANAMRKARISHFVAAHTSVASAEEPPLFINIAKFKLNGTTSNPEGAFEEAKDLNLSENYDGLMIERAATKFSTRNTKKVLIVLSDGEPLAPSYNGYSATEHTKSKIEQLRKRGFIVIAISLVESVVYKNNEIYGAKWNIDASGDLFGQMKKIVEEISKR